MSLAERLVYFLPERGESLKDARPLPAQWDDGCNETWDDYAELVARYHNSLDPQSTDVTVTVVGGGCCATFEVQAEPVLMFRAMEIPE